LGVAIAAVFVFRFADSAEHSSIPPPRGAATRIRVQALDDEIVCGESTKVQVWLDDLWGAPQTQGVFGFEIGVGYDPEILSPREPGPGPFVPSHSMVDDGAGWVSVSVDVARDPLDPVKTGEAALLTTFTFDAVGGGASELTLAGFSPGDNALLLDEHIDRILIRHVVTDSVRVKGECNRDAATPG
jgi:hypothetical protein